jgi:ankyrin repeat protein
MGVFLTGHIDTPLHLCMLYNSTQCVVYLLARGARDTLRVRNKSGHTPLDLARLAEPAVDLNTCNLASMYSLMIA